MGKIKATIKILENRWEIVEDLTSTNQVEIDFVLDNGPVIIPGDRLQFGYQLRSAEEVIQTGVFPPAGSRYTEITNLNIIDANVSNLKSDNDYTLHVWAVYNGNIFQESLIFRTEKPEAPYTSWVWDSVANSWIAPIAYPSNGKYYGWDEDELKWIEVTP
jgi:hypothetical protein